MSRPRHPSTADFQAYIECAHLRVALVQLALCDRVFIHSKEPSREPEQFLEHLLHYQALRLLLLKMARVRGFFRRTIHEHGLNVPPPVFGPRPASS